MLQHSSADIRALLRKHWGYDSFRELQEEIILSVLGGHDTVGLMPTGGGKSITFQIPALALGGLTVVVTPLVSLMKDQADNLQSRGLRAVYMHSAMSYREMKHAWDKITNTDSCHFLYVSPERLAGDHFCQQLQMIRKVRMVVVDEAHCISQWGYDFRPSYLNIARLRRFLPQDVRFMALTASATPEVVEDIRSILQMRDCRVFRKSFRRSNISYVVRHCDDRESMILKVLQGVPGSSILYVRSRQKTRELADFLQQNGLSAEAFHAGMTFEMKEERQRLWKEGRIRVIVATNAFGMGIDKPDVRSVVHYALPSSLEEYYQEAGRAGRDGLPSYAVALVGRNDKTRLRRRIAETFPPKERIGHIYEMLCNFLHISLEEGAGRVYPFDMEEFCRTFGFQERQVAASLGILAGAGYLEYIEDTDSSPRVMFVCDREELYNFNDGELPGSTRVIHALLRNYPGLFSDYVAVSENLLVHESGLESERLHELLVALSRMKIISFIPRRTVPCIFMSRPREEPRYLVIPRSVYEERRDALEHRIEAVIDFSAPGGECRQVRLLRYFGEEDTSECGCCDTCRERLRSGKRKVSDKALVEHILGMLREYPHGIEPERLLSSLPACRRRLGALVSAMEDEGLLTTAHNCIILNT